MVNSKTKISIIVPIYNAEKYLKKCINSIQEQTYRNLQIILIDDGSIDNSLCMCEQLAKEDFRIEIYHTENRGSVVARKYGLKVAKGEYIGFIDADDYIDKDMFYNLSYILKETEADFVHSGYIEETLITTNIICNFEDIVVDLHSIEERIDFLKKYVLDRKDNKFISSSLWSKLYRSEFIKNCFEYVPDEQQYGEDLICLCKCILKSNRIALYKYAAYHYVIREKTLSHVEYDECMIKEVKLWNNILKILDGYKYFGLTAMDISNYLKKRMLYVLSMDVKQKLKIQRFYIKEIEQIIGKKIVLYGAGAVGQDYYSQICRYRDCKIVAWVDSKGEKYLFDYAPIINAINVVNLEFDIIIIAVKSSTLREEIKATLLNNGICPEKIFDQEPEMYF